MYTYKQMGVMGSDPPESEQVLLITYWFWLKL